MGLELEQIDASVFALRNVDEFRIVWKQVNIILDLAGCSVFPVQMHRLK